MGQIFKTMREDRKFMIKELSDEVVTSATISRFETGHTIPNVMTFFRLLKNANISMDDYLYTLNKTEHLSILLDSSIAEAFERRDIIWLESYLKELIMRSEQDQEKRDALAQVYVKLHIYALDKTRTLHAQDVTLISRYLRSIGKWGKLEIALFSAAIPVLETSFLVNAMVDLLSLFTNDLSLNTQRIYYQCMSNLMRTFIDRREYYYAQRLVDFFENERIPDIFIREKVYAYFSIAFFHYATDPEKREKHLNKMKKVIESLESFNATSCASFLEHELREILVKFPMKP